MVTDANFSDRVDASYEAIKELWTTKTCIFMSATARPFFDYWELRNMIPGGTALSSADGLSVCVKREVLLP
ncbi:MAG: hypothetical protein ACLVJH_08745 [Faecalibacterium prausnitzii]